MVIYVVYSFDGAINDFFNSNTTTTRQQCEDFAVARAGGVPTPLQMQGVCSYTVTAGTNNSKLIQFRTEDSILDMSNTNLAKALHPEFVAGCEYLGTLGESRPLHIYEMDNLPGIAHIMAKIPADDMSRQSNTVRDLARFFAQSWNSDQRPSPNTTATMLKEYQSYFNLLARDLPSRFASNVEMVRTKLPALFSGALPFVLSHGDLNMMNILVNPETGNITGIVDWAEARILPFGFALYGLECILGWMDSKRWHYYDGHRELESLFWRTFHKEARGFSDSAYHLLRAARMAGLFYRYGFDFDAEGAVQVCAWMKLMVLSRILMPFVLLRTLGGLLLRGPTSNALPNRQDEKTT